MKKVKPKQKSEDRRRLIAGAAVSATAPASQIVAQIGGLERGESILIAAEITKRSGDTAYLEEILLAQAVALNVFSSDCLLKAGNFLQSGRVAQFPELTTALAKLGLRSQDQARKTILALHELKNPKKPSQFIQTYVDKQLNTLKAEIPQPNQHQLQEDTRAPMDIGSQSEAIPSYQELETLGEQHGPSD